MQRLNREVYPRRRGGSWAHLLPWGLVVFSAEPISVVSCMVFWLRILTSADEVKVDKPDKLWERREAFCGASDMLLHGAYEEKRADVSGAFAGWLLVGGLEFLPRWLTSLGETFAVHAGDGDVWGLGTGDGDGLESFCGGARVADETAE